MVLFGWPPCQLRLELIAGARLERCSMATRLDSRRHAFDPRPPIKESVVQRQVQNHGGHLRWPINGKSSGWIQAAVGNPAW